MPIAIDKIVDGFPFPTVPPIVGTPTYNTIAEVNLKLISNSAFVQSNLGCGTLGLLQLTVSPAIYQTLSSIPFIVPVNPGSVGLLHKMVSKKPFMSQVICYTNDIGKMKLCDNTSKISRRY